MIDNHDLDELVLTIVALEGYLELASEGPWQGAQVPGMTSREDILSSLRENWISGPNSVDNECFHIMANEGDEKVSVCVTGNGPKRRDNTRAIVSLRNAMPTILHGVGLLLDERRKVEDGLRDMTKFLAAMQLNGDAARVMRENGLWRDGEEPKKPEASAAAGEEGDCD